MAKEKKQRDSYKIILYNETTLHETTSFRVNMLNMVAYAGALIIVIALLTAILFIYTPLNSFLPKQDDEDMKWALTTNAKRMDSISTVLLQRQEYFSKIRNIMNGRSFDEYDENEDTTTIERQHADFTKSKHDSIVRILIEEETQQTLALINSSGKEKYKRRNFFMPVHGTLTSKFNPEIKHWGIDIAAKEDEPILATLSGTVILATWTIETGNTIQIQHDDNLISVYKHNSVLLKNAGDKVQAGDPIAIIGNSGEFTSGTHLHFEIWHDGVPVNPEDYLIFPQ